MLAGIDIAIERDAVALALSGADVGTIGPPVAAAARPGSPAAIASLVRAGAALGLEFAASSTGGYRPLAPERTVAIDMAALNRVVAIDPVNMFVLMEAGCTWASLDAALAPVGLRAAAHDPTFVHGQRLRSGSHGTKLSALLGSPLPE